MDIVASSRQKELNSYINNYTTFNDWLIRRRHEHLKTYFKGASCLELGSCGGTGTHYLVEHFSEVVAVDGSEEAISSLNKRIKSHKLTTICSYFEQLPLALNDKKFDTIILAHILEHVDDPVNVIKIAKTFLSKDGVIIIDVPNGDSLHRQVGVKMGLLSKVTELNKADLSIGHKRVYTPSSFRADIEAANLNIIKLGGMFTKVISNKQSEELFSEEQLEAMFKVGTENPLTASEIFAICETSQGH